MKTNAMLLALALVVLAGGWYARGHIPCGWYRLESASGVPVRCLSYFDGR